MNNQRLQTEQAAIGVNDLHSKFPNGITLSWSVDACVKTETGLIQKIKNKCGRDEGPNESSAAMSPQLAYYNQLYQQQEQHSNIKQILSKVNGIVKPGQLCAIMGASGAGKTSLLNILNFRNRKQFIIEEDIRVNGIKVKSNEIRHFSGYVQQSNHFIPTFTVREQLIFYAMLRMDRNFPASQKYARVDELIYQLNLAKCENTRIGYEKLSSGLSGGEKRRLAFAAEILNNPPLLFADEPTTGLDTFMAIAVVDIMSNLVREGRTLICTIHQPSSQIFDKIDILCLLSEGRVAFMGSRKEAYTFFSRLGFRCPSSYNPADYFIRVLAVRSTTRNQDVKKVKRICDQYSISEYNQRVINEIYQTSTQNRYSFKIEVTKDKYKTSYLTQFRWLLWRDLLNVLRNPIATYILLAQTIVMGLFNGLVYLQIKLDEFGVQNYTGILFLMLVQTNFAYIFSVVNSYPFELPVLYAELKSRTYSSILYFLSKQMAETPKFILFPFILITLMFWMSGISTSTSVYFIITSIFVLTVQVAIGFSTFASILAPRPHFTLPIIASVLPLLMILSGVLLNIESIPDYFNWARYLSWFYYSYETASVELWKTIKTIPCTQKSNANNSNICLVQACFRDGNDVLNALNFKKSNVDRNIGLLFTLAITFRIASLVVLKIKSIRL